MSDSIKCPSCRKEYHFSDSEQKNICTRCGCALDSLINLHKLSHRHLSLAWREMESYNFSAVEKNLEISWSLKKNKECVDLGIILTLSTNQLNSLKTWLMRGAS